MKKNFTLLLSCVFLCLSFAASAQNKAIDLTGANFISTSIPVIPSNSVGFTVEFWAYVPSSQPGLHQFVSQGDYSGGAGFGFSIGYDGSNGNIYLGNVLQSTNTNVTMPIGVWVHIAVVYDNNNSSSTLYLNGVEKMPPAGDLESVGSGSNLVIGAQSDNTQLMTGRIDELRIWDNLRTPAEIRSNLFTEVDPASADLVAYYKMDDNTATVVNSSITGPNSAGNSADGDFGTGAAWVSSPLMANSNAINLSGTTDGVTIPTSPAYDLAGGGTIEMWVKPTSLPGTGSTLIANRGAGGTRFSLHMINNAFVVWTGNFNAVGYNNLSLLNTWSHLAFVYNSTANTVTVFLNGALLTATGAPTSVTSATFGAPGGYPLTIGNDEANENFSGSIDEVHIWSTQRSQSEITADMGVTLSGSEPNLIGLWSFDAGIPDGDNNGLKLALDNSPAFNDGALSLSLAPGMTSNFTSSAPISPLPVNFTSFTATAQEDQALLQWQTAQEQNSRDYSIERSSDGAKYTAIGSVAAAGNSSLPSDYSFVDAAPLNGKNYYRLKESDLDNKFMYSEVRMLNFTLGAGQKLVWFQTGAKSVEVDLKAGSNEIYIVTDISGRTIQQGQLSSGKLYLSQVPGGIYVVKVITASGKQLNTKVLVK